jgi:E3 ubiquitin-protein ligase SIAH1
MSVKNSKRNDLKTVILNHSQVMAHLMQVHKSITTLQGEDIVFLATDINLPGAVDWVMMQSCFGHHFM